MQTYRFCPIFLLCFCLFPSLPYSGARALQADIQDPPRFFEQKPLFDSNTIQCAESKCPSGGSNTGSIVDADYPLLVFVSFSMPEPSLLSFADELKTYGGAYVIRGLPDNSFQEFFNRVHHLKTLGVDAPFLIDPDSFEKYDVDAAPVIVLREENVFDKLVGNIPLAFALEIFAEKGETKLRAKKILSDSIFPRPQSGSNGIGAFRRARRIE